MRVMVVWCPDWPVVAALTAEELPVDLAAAVFADNTVVAASQAARSSGVRPGMRRRDAQSRCPELTVLGHRPERDARVFEPVLAAVEDLCSHVAPMRPGLCAVRAPGRYYGDESRAGALVAEGIVGLGVWDCRIGVADGAFAAEQAARRTPPQETTVIAAGASSAFLAELSVDVLDDPELAGLLHRLGLHTLGAFAALPYEAVHTRFGAAGERLHRIITGRKSEAVAGRRPPPQTDAVADFEPPLDSAEAVAFSMRRTAERFVAGLADAATVCTQLGIEIICDGALAHSRSWLHPRWFTAADVVDRIRWQLQGARLRRPVESVRLLPEEVEQIGEHADGLWGGAPAEGVARGVARVQSLLGHEAVATPVVQGGRSPGDRQALVPVGERPAGLRPVDRPWPGTIPGPAPVRVFRSPPAATVLSATGRPIGVSGRGALTAEPTRFRPTEGEGLQPVAAWAGPWPVEERWWDADTARRAARLQLVGADGRAWLMVVEDGRWWTEAGYD